MRFLNINFKKKNEASAFGIIGGTDGTTSISIAKKEEQDKFLSYAAEKIIPCDRTFKQLEEYLVEKYNAVPHTLLPHELNTLKANVILNRFDHVLDKPVPLGENPTRKEIKAYFEQDTSFFQAKEYPAEKLGLEMKAYRLPGIAYEINIGNKPRDKNQSAVRISSYTDEDVIVEMEMKSEYILIINGSRGVSDDLLLYQGVSEKDIKERTNRFIAYAYTLKHMGKL